MKKKHLVVAISMAMMLVAVPTGSAFACTGGTSSSGSSSSASGSTGSGSGWSQGGGCSGGQSQGGECAGGGTGSEWSKGGQSQGGGCAGGGTGSEWSKGGQSQGGMSDISNIISDIVGGDGCDQNGKSDQKGEGKQEGKQECQRERKQDGQCDNKGKTEGQKEEKGKTDDKKDSQSGGTPIPTKGADTVTPINDNSTPAGAASDMVEPKTADAAPIIILVSALGLSAITMAIIFIRKKRLI